MPVEIKIGDRVAWVNLLKQEGNMLAIEVDGKKYDVDLMHTAGGTFSIIENGHSYDIELVPKDGPKKYTAHTLHETFDVEVIDAEARYLQNRNAGASGAAESKITSPMPGKVVKVLVTEGDPVQKGETVIIISAMKMESEYKAPRDGVVKKVYVKSEDTVDGSQVLIELE